MYKSQYSQDKFIDIVIFNKKRNGFFIDIGAHDGVTFSNSFFFEKKRQWKGVCIEPNPNVFNKLKENRNSSNYNVCIGNKNDFVEFNQISGSSEMLSGVIDKYNIEHKVRIKKEIKENGGAINIIKSKMIILDTLQELNNQNIDFISIDTEGNELDILNSINFNKLNIKCIVVENNYKDYKINATFIDNNFILMYKLHTDQVYINKKEYTFRVKLRLFLWKVKSKLNKYWN